ncbi:MAG: PhoU domain-containing protein, partial [Promethearchaeota archaeon]
MEVKKVQEVKGSYYVYLPKSWCKKYIFNVGDKNKNKIKSENLREVQLKVNADDSISILPRAHQFSDKLRLYLKINESINEESCLNSLLAAYIVGVDWIELESNYKFSLTFRDKIAQLLKSLIGFEITEETGTKIIIKEVSTTLELDGMMGQLLAKVGLLLTYVADIMHNLNKKDAKIVISQDDEIDKFRYSIERQVHQILRQPYLAQKLKITSIECLHFSQCTKYLERIADHCVGIANFIVEGKSPSPSLLKNYEEVRDLYRQLHKNFNPVDVDANYNIISQHLQIIKNLEKIELEESKNKLFALPLKRIC